MSVGTIADYSVPINGISAPAIGISQPDAAVSPVSVKPMAVRPAATGRNDAIDVIRLFAAAGIVFVHAGESVEFDRWGNLFRFGVPFFLFASLFYQSRSFQRHTDRSLAQMILGRIKRLYIPFLIWSLIYLIVRDVKRVVILHQSPVTPHLSMLWTGTEYHLWFLPFLLFCSIGLAFAQRMLFRHNPSLRWPAIGIAIGIGLALARGAVPAMPPVTESTFDSPSFAYIQWYLALPAACWAFAFAWMTTLSSAISSVPLTVGIAGLALAAVCSVKQAVYGIELAPRALSGLGCMLAALAPWHGVLIDRLSKLGRMGFGIYLCHVIPVEVFHLISHKLQIPSSSWLDVLTFELSFVCSFGIVALLSRSQRTAWLVG